MEGFKEFLIDLGVVTTIMKLPRAAQRVLYCKTLLELATANF